MMQTVVVEEKIYNSTKNVRSELLNIRKAFPHTSFINTSSSLTSGNSYTVSACSFFHFHSSSCVTIQIKKNGQLITLENSQLITLNGVLDQVIITNNQDNSVDIYITYAC